MPSSSPPFFLAFVAPALLSLFGCGNAEETPAAPTSDLEGSRLIFTDITAESGLGGFRHVNGAFGDKRFPESMGAGGAFVDYDGDGWLDVLLVTGNPWPDQKMPAPPALTLYRNNGNGTFTDQTSTVGLASVRAYGMGVVAADYDNDGDDDFYFTTLQENMLFRNDGGTFSEVGAAAGVQGASTWSTAGLFFDADRDGHLDLWVGNYIQWSIEEDLWCSFDGERKAYCTPELYNGVSGRFYHNNGDGTFTDRTAAVGLENTPGKSLGVVELDYNDDGWPDFAVASDTQQNLLFENNCDGTFSERGMISGIAFDEQGKARAGMGIDAGDVNGDGQPTIFIGNFSQETISVYEHTGNGLFIDRSYVSKIGQPSLASLTFGLIVFDADLDGDLDVLAVNGHIDENIDRVQEGISYRQTPQLFMNNGNGSFELNNSAGTLVEDRLVGRGAAYGDVDRDGDLDVLITENGGPAHLYRNDLRRATGNESKPSYLRVRLEGNESNRQGIGARVLVVTGSQRQERRVRTGSSYLSQGEIAATFGLGSASTIDSLIVYWPSAQIDRFSEVATNQVLHIVEGSSTLTATLIAEP